jgi:hypothetical protein
MIESNAESDRFSKSTNISYVSPLSIRLSCSRLTLRDKRRSAQLVPKNQEHKISWSDHELVKQCPGLAARIEGLREDMLTATRSSGDFEFAAMNIYLLPPKEEVPPTSKPRMSLCGRLLESLRSKPKENSTAPARREVDTFTIYVWTANADAPTSNVYGDTEHNSDQSGGVPDTSAFDDQTTA